MKIIIKFRKNRLLTGYTTNHDTSITEIIPKIGDEVIDEYADGVYLRGLVQRRSFDYIREIITIYVKI